MTSLDSSVVRLGTRRSPLALAQSRGVAAAVTAVIGRPVELVEVTTEGDLSPADLTQIGGTGVFVSALRQALLDRRIDVAVHSLKDLPTAPSPGVLLAAVPVRGDARDVLIARDGLRLAQLPPGSRLGTGSPRRAAQILALGLGQVPVPVRGNVGTRIGLVRDGVVDGVLLARAGLVRLGREAEVSEIMDPIQLLPAPGQGALAIECRADAPSWLVQALAAVDDADTRAAVTAERSLLAALEAGCTAPVGALAEIISLGVTGLGVTGVGSGKTAEAAGNGVSGLVGSSQLVREISLRAVVAAVDGTRVLRRYAVGSASDPVALGRSLAGHLVDDGAAQLLGCHPRGRPQSGMLSDPPHRQPGGSSAPDLSISPPALERAP